MGNVGPKKVEVQDAKVVPGKTQRALKAGPHPHQQEHVSPEDGLSEDQESNPMDQRQAIHDGDAESTFERHNRRSCFPDETEDTTRELRRPQ